jgi:aspartate carbamoyltransferase catalytic subunit
MKNLVITKGGDERLRHRVLSTMFYEPSTRTSCSFQAAMLRLGGTVLPVHEQSSSTKKGETLEDTIRTLASYSDAIVLRHPMVGSAKCAANVSKKPIINAGDGTGEVNLTITSFIFIF